MSPSRDTPGERAAGPAELELRLLTPSVRVDREAVDRLLHHDFVEIGASGRVWDRASILAALARDPRAAPEVSDLVSAPLTDGAVLVTYRAVHADGRSTRRASIWLRDERGRWRVRFHQGTPA